MYVTGPRVDRSTRGMGGRRRSFLSVKVVDLELSSVIPQTLKSVLSHWLLWILATASR